MPDVGASVPNTIDASAIATSSLDPGVAQSVLSKIATGQPLLPNEKVAAAKLPPAVLSRVAQSGSAPLPTVASDKPTMAQVRAEGQPQAGTMAEVRKVDDTLQNPPPVAPPQIKTARGPANLTTEQANRLGYVQQTPTPPLASGGVQQIPMVNNPTVTKSVAAQAAAPAQAAAAAPPPVTSGEITKKIDTVKDYLNTQPKGQQIAKIIAYVLDAIGVGMSARGGVSRESLAGQQIKANIQSQLMTKQAQLDLQNKLAALDPETKQAIAQALAIGNIQVAQSIAQKKGILPYELQLAQQSRFFSNPLFYNPQGVAASIVNGGEAK